MTRHTVDSYEDDKFVVGWCLDGRETKYVPTLACKERIQKLYSRSYTEWGIQPCHKKRKKVLLKFCYELLKNKNYETYYRGEGFLLSCY